MKHSHRPRFLFVHSEVGGALNDRFAPDDLFVVAIDHAHRRSHESPTADEHKAPA